MTRSTTVLKILGILLVLSSLTQLPPLLISYFSKDGIWFAFAYSAVISLVLGLLLWWPNQKKKSELRFRDGFLVVVLIWLVLSLMASLPFALADSVRLSWVDSIFEAVSGLTTTGATVLTGIDDLPISLLYYRQQLQWLGGMGIIVLAVAVMPMLGVGGMQLYRAETPGPVKDNKLTPRITETAKALWYIYLGLTVVCALGYYIAGMTLFDAISHAYSTVAIGGFSTHDASLGYFQSNAVYLVAVVFMLLSSLNFALHFAAIRSRRVSIYLKDSEARIQFLLGALAFLFCIWILSRFEVFDSFAETAMQSLVQVVSIGTTTGFTTTDFATWPLFLPVLLILLSTGGGCAGSTAGGMKMIRVILLFKQGAREISKLVHPNALIPIKLGGKPVPENVINAVWGFLSLYLISDVVLLVLMLGTGADILTAFSAVSACLNNLGPGLGDVAQNYSSITDAGKLILSFTMLLGRLELYTLLVLLTPVFWKI